MKLYKTTATLVSTEADDKVFHEFASSANDASKARTRLKKAGLIKIDTDEVDVLTDRASLIVFLNKLTGHKSATVAAVADALKS
ncbi:MAG TPA: hypothetical protein PK861_01040 [Thermomonas sp.]|nr:hypothetical protein [Thermomonas sp.]